MEKKKRKIPWSKLYIIATIIAVIIFGIANRQLANAFNILSNLAPGFLLFAIVIIAIYYLFEGGILALLMRSQKIKMKLSRAMWIGVIGIYYSYITPSATGGQPMQSAYLRRDKIPVGVSTAVLIIKFFCFQSAFFLCSIISFFFMLPKLQTENPSIIPLVILGLIINGGSCVFFPCLFIRRFMALICGIAKWFVKKLPFLRKKQVSVFAAIEVFQEDFASYTDDFKGKLGSIIAGILLSVPQFFAQMSVIYFVFRAFGYNDINYLEVFAVQSLLQVSVSFMPMPGASGAQEIGFSTFFKNYFVNDDLYAAVMVWRFFTYYLMVIFGALLVVVDQLTYRKKPELINEDEKNAN